jgi:chaperonin GroES
LQNRIKKDIIIPVFKNKLFCRELGEMDKKKQIETKPLEIVEPIGKRVLIRKDQDKKQTKGGIRLPDNIEIPTITGRIITISAEVENSLYIPLRQYDKVLFNPKGAIPVDFEGDNRLFVVEVENVVAVFRKA